ncbi:MAG: hypothetical protein KGL39_26135 [Patescibacteria group bacterium]|nr:hypothetical protein [Patescibacteria group bacterium]
MPKFASAIVGGAEMALGFIDIATFGFGTGFGLTFAPYLIAAGAGTLLGGLGTMLSKGPAQGFSTTMRSPTAPWRYVYGAQRVGGTIVYLNLWPAPGNGAGGKDQILDMVIVLAAHGIYSVDALLFDMQRVQIRQGVCVLTHQTGTGALNGGPYPGTGTSYSPGQYQLGPGAGGINSIQRLNGVVTVTLNGSGWPTGSKNNLVNFIDLLLEGDRVQIAGIDTPYDTTLNGIVTVEQIIASNSSTPSITFTFLNGGANTGVITGQGQVNSLWADYGQTVYFEPMLGGQSLGQSFNGMVFGTPYLGDLGDIISPSHTGGVQGQDQPNPWTSDCSLMGKSAVMLRMAYSSKYYSGGIPQISFLVRGKNDIADYRTSPATVGYSTNAALCIADWLATPEEFGGFGCTYGNELNISNINAAANTCDEAIPLGYSLVSPPLTEPAYALNGQFTLDTRRGEVLRNMLTAMGGRIVQSQGQVLMYPAAWVGNSFAIGSNPGGGVIALGDMEAIAAGPVKWHPTTSIRELYNGVKGTYIASNNKWQSTDFPPYAQDSLHGYSGPSLYAGDANLAYDGGERRWLDIQLPFTTSYSTAQRLAKIELLRRRTSGANSRGSGTLTLNMSAYQIATLDLLIITWAAMGWTAKQFEVIDVRFAVRQAEDGGSALVTEVDIIEVSSDIYNWNTNEELTPAGYQHPVIPGVGPFSAFVTEMIPGIDAPYPWRAGYESPLVGDAIWTGPKSSSPVANIGPSSFGISVEYGTDANGSPVVDALIKGTAPPNLISAGSTPPQISCTAGTSGSLPAGTYWVSCAATISGSPNGITALATPVKVTIPVSSPPASNGSIAVTITWPNGVSGGYVYMSYADPYQTGGINAGAEGWWTAATVASPSTTSVTLTKFNQASGAAPDVEFDHLAVAWKQVIHSGIWAQQVQAVTSTTVTIAGSGMTTNMYAGRVLSLLGKLDSTQDLAILNMPVASNTASSGTPAEFVLTIGNNSAGDQLPDLTTLLTVGDLVVMRFAPTFSAQGFSDSLIANPYYPNGAASGSPLTPTIEAGHIALVLSGADAGDFQTIESVGVDGFGNYTVINLANPWAVQPSAGDLVIIVDAQWGPEYHTPPRVPGPGVITGTLATVPIANLPNQTWVFITRSQNSDDINGADQFCHIREIYAFGQAGTDLGFAGASYTS